MLDLGINDLGIESRRQLAKVPKFDILAINTDR